MHKDATMLYPIIEHEIISAPNCTILYDLEPIGIGTPFVESLTSYIVRLAQAHCLPVKLLLKSLLLSYVYQDTDFIKKSRYLINRWGNTFRLVNSTGLIANQSIELLSVATLRTDLKHLTLTALCNVISSKRVKTVKDKRAWCPQCYINWSNRGEIIYDPLAWSIDELEICIIHNIYLETKCPNCYKDMSIINHNSQPGYCFHCNNWLGESLNKNSYNENIFQVENLLLYSYNIYYLVGGISTINSGIDSTILINNISKIIDNREKILAGNTIWNIVNNNTITSLKNLLKISSKLNISLLDLLSKEIPVIQKIDNTKHKKNKKIKNPPKTPNSNKNYRKILIYKELSRINSEPKSIKQILYELNIHMNTIRRLFPSECKEITKNRRLWRINKAYSKLKDFIKKPENKNVNIYDIALQIGYSAITLKKFFPDLCLQVIKRKVRVIIDKDALRRFLETVLARTQNPPSTQKEIANEMAQKFGYNESQLKRHFPILAKAITEKRRQYDRDRKDASMQSLINNIYNAVYKVHHQGIYPSANYISRYIKRPGGLRHPQLIDAWRKALGELGLREL